MDFDICYRVPISLRVPGIMLSFRSMKHLLLLAVFACLGASVRGEENSSEKSSPGSDRTVKFHEMKAGKFWKLDAVKEEIDFEHIDFVLLDAAVFHETNRRRMDNDLTALKFKPVLREAARIQVRGMIRMGKVSHQHPDPNKKTMRDRFDFLGIETRLLAENVAMTFGIRYQSGDEFYSRKKDGRTIFSVEANGPPIPPHSYASFAKHLLDEWMASPSHRKNILTPGLVCLGVSSLHDRSGFGMDSFYSAQEFSGKITAQD